MDRRKCVAMIGTVGGLSIAGCLSLGDDPDDVVAAYATAWEEGDRQRADEIIHSDSPWRDDEWWLDDEHDFGPTEEVTWWEFEEWEVTDESESVAIVRQISVWDISDEEPYRLTEDWELRTDDDEWKIWDVEHIETEELDETPD